MRSKPRSLRRSASLSSRKRERAKPADDVRVGEKVHLWLRTSPSAHIRRLRLYGPDPIAAGNAELAASRAPLRRWQRTDRRRRREHLSFLI